MGELVRRITVIQEDLHGVGQTDKYILKVIEEMWAEFPNEVRDIWKWKRKWSGKT